MSATMIAPETVDGLEKLLQLASLNKDNIAAAGEEARKQIQLTQADQGKIAEAKSWIAKHAELSSALQAREDAHAASVAAHEKDKADHTAHVALENTRLENFAASISTRESNVAISEKRNTDEAQSLAAMRQNYGIEHEKAMANVRTAEAANVAIGQALNAEKQRLTDWENVLKGKAQRIKAEAASF